MKDFKLHIPVQPFGFIEKDVEEKDIESVYNKYAETPINFNNGLFKEFETFTGERVMYDDANHRYTDMDGNPLLSGSAYKKSFDKPFDLENISTAVGKKNDIDPQTIKDMWSHNGNTSLYLGNAIHNAMEQWFRFRATGTEKEYHLPKHPFLKDMINTFPLKDEEIIPEVLVSDVGNGVVGQIDGLQITGKKKCNLIDYKSDAKVEDNVAGHFLQLSFYAHILMEFGWKVENIIIYNFVNEWKSFESKVLDLTK